jgi:hypothetical protein
MTHTLYSARLARALRRAASLACAAALAALLLDAPVTAAADGLPAQTTADGLTTFRGEMPSPITDHFYMRISDFAAKTSTRLRIDPTGMPYGGTTVSAESDLGLPSSANQARFELMFRLRERNKLRVDYFQLDRNGDTFLTHPIIFGNQTFAAGDEAVSELDWRMMGFTYTHSFVYTDRFELGAGLGVHLIDADAKGSVPATLQNHETSAAIGVPTIALDGVWRISRRWAFTARGQYLHVAINSWSGSLGDYHGDFQYRWAPAFAVGAGYSIIRAGYNAPSQSNPASFGLNVHGPELFARISF